LPGRSQFRWRTRDNQLHRHVVKRRNGHGQRVWERHVLWNGDYHLHAGISLQRAVAFEARLADPQTNRKFLVGSGQTKSGGSLFMGDATSAADAAASIFNDLQAKGLIGANQA